MKKNKKFRKGAASFYIVAFSTLILMIVAASFAAVIISEITRTSNDDLSQSAYDSALAGVEDAKLAYYSYENCKGTPAAEPNKDNTITCGEMVWYMENPSCDMVGNMLGRTKDDVVAVEEVNTGAGASNNMQQYYTCVEVQDSLKDYRSTLSSSSMIKAMRAKFDDEQETNPEAKIANKISKVKVSWYADSDSSTNITSKDYTNITESGNGVTFPSLVGEKAATPPTISLTMVQTGLSFDINSFDKTIGNTTNRGMVYLVPTSDKTKASTDVAGNSNGSFESSIDANVIGSDAFLKSNDKTAQNLPYKVYCGGTTEGNEFACSATIDLPRPIGGTRNSDTFMFVVGMPYGKAGKSDKVSFLLEFFCESASQKCGQQTIIGEDGQEKTEDIAQANLKGVQVQVDSTGRANDLFRRIETRLEDMDSLSLSIMGPLELLGESGGTALTKDYAVKCEYNFGGPTC